MLEQQQQHGVFKKQVPKYANNHIKIHTQHKPIHVFMFVSA